MSSSQKHADFVRGCMRDRPISDIAGIGDKATAILNEKGFIRAYHMLGQFLVLDKDHTIFDAWIQTEVTCMNGIHRKTCIDCLQEWCDKNL